MKTTLILFFVLLLLILLNYIPSTAQNIPDFLVNEQGSIDGSQQAEPYMDGDGNGNYVVTWKDKRNGTDFDIFAQIYQTNGLPLGENFKVNDDNGTRLQYTPVIAVDPNLNFVIAWIDRRNGDPNNHWDLYAQRFSNNGTTLGENFIVNDELETEEKSHPSVSIDSIGNFVIVWADKRGYPWDIYGQRYTYDGTAQGDNFRINDDTGNYYQLWPTCACDKSGNLIVSWTDKRYDTDRQIYAQRYSADGTALGNNFQVNDNNAGTNNVLPDIAIDGNSNFIIAWEDNRNGHPDIFAQRYMSDGTIIGENFKINENSVDISHRNPSVSADLAGNFNVCWDDNRNDYNDVYARQFNNNGIPVAVDFKVSSDITYNTKQENAIIESDENGNFIICWEDHRFGFNGEIFAQSYLNDGTAVDENFIVNDDIGSENERKPSIALDGNENFIIVWEENRTIGDGVYGQRYTSDGIPIQDNFKINDNLGDNWVLSSSVAANFDGSFVVTWADFRTGNHNIYAQIYSANGTALGNNFKVNYLSAYINYSPVVVCKQNGDFIICWGDSPEDSKINNLYQEQENNFTSKKLIGEPDIWAQQYLSDGTPIGENFKVNDDGGIESQMNPDIAVDGEGDFVVVWEDKRNDIYEIYLQRYLSDGTPLGSNYKVEDSILCDFALAPSVCMEESGDFKVTWRDNRNDFSDIFCKQFSNNGTALGNSFQVNTETGIDYRYSPSISVNTSGDFTIAWTNVVEDGNYDVYAQQYINDGTPYGNNYRVSNTDVMEQSAPEVVLGNSRIFYAWQDNSDGNTGFDIWANVVDWVNIVGVENTSNSELSLTPYLFQNFPNPFSTFTTIKFDLSKSANVRIEVFNHFGQKIETLLDKSFQSGIHEVDYFTKNLADGIYLIRLITNSPGKANESQVATSIIIKR